MSLIRSVIFAIFQTTLTILFSVVALFSFPFSVHTRYRLITGYNHLVIWLARWVLGIRYVVQGAENLPSHPAIILAKHQSAWETVAFLFLFPPVSPVIKQELLKVPFFGKGGPGDWTSEGSRRQSAGATNRKRIRGGVAG